MTENNTIPQQPKRAVTVVISEGGIMRPEQCMLASGGRVTIQLESSESQCITITYPDGKSALLTKLDHPSESFTWEHRHGLGKHVFQSSLWSFAKTTLEVVANNNTISDIECETHEAFDAQIHFPSLLKPRNRTIGQSQSPTDNRHHGQPSISRPAASKAPLSLLTVSTTPKTGIEPSPLITDNATNITLGLLASPAVEDPAPVAEHVGVNNNRRTKTSSPSSLATTPPGGYFPHKEPLIIETNMDSYTDNNDYHFYGSKGTVMHSCARCKQQFVSELNARRCLALHAGIRVAPSPSSTSSATSSPKSREDFQALVTFWDSADPATKIDILSIGLGNDAGRGLASRIKAASIGLECSSPYSFTTRADKMMQDAASLTDVLDLLLCFADSSGHSPLSESSAGEPDSPPYCQDGYHVISLLNTTLEGLINLIPPAEVSPLPSSSASQKIRKNAISNTKLEKKAVILAASSTPIAPITPTLAGIRANLAAEYGAMVLGRLTRSRFEYLEGQAKMMTDLLVEEDAAAHAAAGISDNNKVVLGAQFVSTNKKKKKRNKGKGNNNNKQKIEGSVSSGGTSPPAPSSPSSAISSPAAYGADSSNAKSIALFFLRDNPFFIPDKEEEEKAAAAALVSIEQSGANLINSNSKKTETLIAAVRGANTYSNNTEKNHNSNNTSATIMGKGTTKGGITTPPPPPPPKITAPVTSTVSYAAVVKDGTSSPSSASSSPTAPIPLPATLVPAANKSAIVTEKKGVPSVAPSVSSSSSSSSPAKASHPPMSPSPPPPMHQQQHVEMTGNDDNNLPLQGTPQSQHASPPPMGFAPYQPVPHPRHIDHHHHHLYGPYYPPPPPPLHYWAHPVYFNGNHYPQMASPQIIAPQSSFASPSLPPVTSESSPSPPPPVVVSNPIAMQPFPMYQHVPPMYFSPSPSPPPLPPHHYQHHPQYMFHPGAQYYPPHPHQHYPQDWGAMPPPPPPVVPAAAVSAATGDDSCGKEEQAQGELKVFCEEIEEDKDKEPATVTVATAPAAVEQNASPKASSKPADCTIEDATTSPVIDPADQQPQEEEEEKALAADQPQEEEEEEKDLTDQQPQEEESEIKEEDTALFEALLDPNTVVLECSDRASFFYGLMKNAREEAGLTKLAAQAAGMEEEAREREEARGVGGSRECNTCTDENVNAADAVSPPLSGEEDKEEVEGTMMESTSFVALLTSAVVKQKLQQLKKSNEENAVKSNQPQKAQQEALAKPTPAGALPPTIVGEEGRGRGSRRGRRNRGRGKGRGRNNKNKNNTNDNDNDISNACVKFNNVDTGSSSNNNNNSWLIAAKRAM